ncbi:MAG: hypothetical protein H0U73_12485 [Tatlockia sp.]|nr:hypothetical protein [Tatlockia sp.]
MKNFLTGIALIGLIVITGFVPGLFITAGFYAAGYSLFSLFKSKGDEFLDQIDKLPKTMVINYV